VECWNLTGNQISPNPNFSCPYYDMSTAKNKRIAYQFDHLFPPSSATDSIYSTGVRSVVLASMMGYHSSVFTYGQTASGKTFTMQGTGSSPGIIPLAVNECFDYAYNKANESREFLLRVGYIEIYNETIVDLLSPRSVNSVRIYENKGGVVVKGMKEEVVVSPEHVFALISSGEAHRHVGSTNMNANSSRSHTIFRLVIESKQHDETSVRVSTLSLVDLAGSESVKQSNTTGERRKEGHYINKSLLTLGHVIWKLSEASRKHPNMSFAELSKHIPYRDSKLTRLLQPSLGGNAQISIICNISPLSAHVEESHNTLKFASRAKRIRQTATINEGMDDATLLKQYREEIEGLREQLKNMQEASAAAKMQQEAGFLGPGGVDPVVNTDPNAYPGDEDEREETQALEVAIHNLERLILRNADKKAGGGSGVKRHGSTGAIKGKSFFENGADGASGPQGLFFKRNSVGGGATKAAAAVAPQEEKKEAAPSTAASNLQRDLELEGAALDITAIADERMRALSVRSSTPESVSSSHVEAASLVNELQRVQGLLGAVLDKRNTRRQGTGLTPSAGGGGQRVGPYNGTPSYSQGGSSPVRFGGGGFSSGDIEELRAEITRLDLENKVNKADAHFLEQQLNDKDSMLKEVAGVLDAVEKHQEDLEKENNELAEALTRTQRILDSREQELFELKGINAEEEMF
jgi:hypothetical protein